MALLMKYGLLFYSNPCVYLHITNFYYGGILFMLYSSASLNELKEKEKRKYFFLKRILLFIILFIALSNKITLFTDNIISLNLSFSLPKEFMMVLLLSIIYSVIEFLYLKNVIIIKKSANDFLHMVAFFVFQIIIFLNFNLEIYPQFENHNDTRTYFGIFIFSIIISITRLNFIKRMLSN